MSKRTGPAPGKESGPAEGTPTKTLASTAHSTATADSPAPLNQVTPLPLRWAKEFIDAADGPIPEYGSSEWAELPNGPEKVASCVLSAERWRTRHHLPEFIGGRGNRRSREITEARRPRPGDHPGGAVQWDAS